MKTYQNPKTHVSFIASSMITMLTASVNGGIKGINNDATYTPDAV